MLHHIWQLSWYWIVRIFYYSNEKLTHTSSDSTTYFLIYFAQKVSLTIHIILLHAQDEDGHCCPHFWDDEKEFQASWVWCPRPSWSSRMGTETWTWAGNPCCLCLIAQLPATFYLPHSIFQMWDFVGSPVVLSVK